MPWPDVQKNRVLEQEDPQKNMAPKIGVEEKSDAGVLRHRQQALLYTGEGKRWHAESVWTAAR